MASKKICVGIIQENPIVGDIAGNLELAKNAISKLSKESSRTPPSEGALGLAVQPPAEQSPTALSPV